MSIVCVGAHYEFSSHQPTNQSNVWMEITAQGDMGGQPKWAYELNTHS